MKAAVLILSFFSLCTTAFSQKQFTVKFKVQYLTRTTEMDADNNTIFRWQFYPTTPEYFLAIKDSISSFRRSIQSYTPGVQHFPGDSIISYTDVDAGKNYMPVSPITEKPLMLQEPLGKLDWKFTGEADTICGYPCRIAVAVTDDQYVYAWYAYDLPKNFGPFACTGLPGTILCLEYSRSYERYRAIEVRNNSVDVQIPETAHISPNEYADIMKMKRSYRGGFFGPKLDPYEVPRITPTGNTPIRY